MQMLQELLAGTGKRPVDPRATAVQQMMMAPSQGVQYPGMKTEADEQMFRQKNNMAPVAPIGSTDRMTPEQSMRSAPPQYDIPPNSTEEEIKAMQDQMDKGLDGESAALQHQMNLEDDSYEWEGEDSPTEKDIQAVRDNPTDSMIENFIERFGEDALPEDMRNDDPNAEDYVGVPKRK